MASKRQLSSNRVNAQRSTGPTSAEEKSTSSLNALRHGLSVEAAHDSETAAQVDALAGVISQVCQ